MKRSTVTTIVGAVIIVAASIWMVIGYEPKQVRYTVKLPELSATERHGQKVFNATCAACHGTNAGGSSKGPRLIHKVYRRIHHADAAFNIAIAKGVRPHHWKFGAMPPQPDIDPADIPAIIAFVRAVQRANNIH